MEKIETHGFRVDEAVKYNVTKAIVLGTVRRWITYKKRINKGVYSVNGKSYWFAYISSRALEQELPYLGKSAIRNSLSELEEADGILLSGVFNNVKWDKTKWYTIPSEFENVTFDCPKVDTESPKVDDNTSPYDSPFKEKSISSFSLREAIPSLQVGSEYAPDGVSLVEKKEKRKRLQKSLGLDVKNPKGKFMFEVGNDFLKACKAYTGVVYVGNVHLEQVAKNLSLWYDMGETRETMRGMLDCYFSGKKGREIVATPTAVFSSHTYNAWKQGKLSNG